MITTFGHTDLKEIGVVAYGDRYKVLNGIQNIQNMNNLKPISITSAHTGQSFGGQSVSLMADGDGRHHVNNKPKIDETRQDYAEDINKELDSILNLHPLHHAPLPGRHQQVPQRGQVRGRARLRRDVSGRVCGVRQAAAPGAGL